jgi:hypothetical protein
MTASAVALLFLLYNLMQHATDIIKKIQSGDIAPLDIERIIGILTQADTLQMQIATSVLLILWVIGIVDSYRLSRNEGRNEGRNKSSNKTINKTKKIIPIKSI